jgi:hypothetical protein
MRIQDLFDDKISSNPPLFPKHFERQLQHFQGEKTQRLSGPAVPAESQKRTQSRSSGKLGAQPRRRKADDLIEFLSERFPVGQTGETS